jgi:acyl-CoA hydrolase
MSDGLSTAQAYRLKVVTAQAAAAAIHDGDVVVVSGGAAHPATFLQALSDRYDLARLTVLSPLALAVPPFSVVQHQAVVAGKVPTRGMRFSCFDVGPGARSAACAGVIDAIPASATAMSALVQQGKVDVLVLASPGMDAEGRFNLGSSVDWMPDMLTMAKRTDTLVILEANPRLPFTCGDTAFPLDAVDYVVESDEPLPELGVSPMVPEAHAVGGYLASVVPDEATLHLDASDLVRQASTMLEARRDLGVHSDVLSDAFLYLRQRGALTCRRKSADPGIWVGSSVLGSAALMEFVSRNPAVQLRPIGRIADPATIANNSLMVSVTRATQVDLTGQIAGISPSFEFAGNPGIQQIFHASACLSPGGCGVALLPSSAQNASASNIVATLARGHAVGIPRTDADTVITEYGVARLRGASIRQRALSLIAIAHPAHRDRLASEARSTGLV